MNIEFTLETYPRQSIQPFITLARFSYDNEQYQRLVAYLNFIFSETGLRNPFIFLPKYTYLLMPIVKVKHGTV